MSIYLPCLDDTLFLKLLQHVSAMPALRLLKRLTFFEFSKISLADFAISTEFTKCRG